jgi:hypothetical protein
MIEPICVSTVRSVNQRRRAIPLLGIILLGLALLRSRAIARWASVVLLGLPVLHVIGLFAGNEWFEAAGSICQLVGFAAVALALPGQVAETAARPVGALVDAT